MGLKKKTINLVKKVLNNDNKRAMYTPEELAYMEMQLKNLIDERKRRVKQRKLEKGFGTDV
jgi:hypothetical protein